MAAALNTRMAARRVGQQELAQLSGISVSTLRQVQHGAGRRVQNKTLTAISRALAWPDDHLAAILMSDRGAPVPDSTGQDGDQVLAALLRVEQQLRELNQRLGGIETIISDRNGADGFDGDCFRR